MNKHGIFNLVILSVTVCLLHVQFSNGADATAKQESKGEDQTKQSSDSPKKQGGSMDALRGAIKSTLEKMDPQELSQKPDMKVLLKKVVNDMDWDALGIKGLDGDTLKMALSMNDLRNKNPGAFPIDEDDEDFPEIPNISGMPDLSLLYEQLENKEKQNSKSEPKESKTEPKSESKPQILPGIPGQALPNILNIPGLDLDMGPLLQFGNLMNTGKDSPLVGIQTIIEAGQTVVKIRREGRRSECLSNNGYSVAQTMQDMELCLERFPFICFDVDHHNTCNAAFYEKKREERLARTKRIIGAMGKAMKTMNSLGLKVPLAF